MNKQRGGQLRNSVWYSKLNHFHATHPRVRSSLKNLSVAITTRQRNVAQLLELLRLFKLLESRAIPDKLESGARVLGSIDNA